jgi:hypothetical protein
MEEHLRISDAERERAAAELAEHYALGRLTTAEHAERLDRIWAARTRGELAPVFGDLPGAVVPAVPERVRRRPGRAPFRVFPLLAVVVVVAVVAHAPWLLALPLIALMLVARRAL